MERKLVILKRPTELDYKKGYLSEALSRTLIKSLFGKRAEELSRNATNFYAAVENAMINALTTHDIDKIINIRSRHFRYELFLNATLECLGLPQPAIGQREFRKAIVQFMNKKSEYWKYRNNVIEMKRARKRNG